jgi:hypothetical protein
MSMLLFLPCDPWSIIGDSGCIVSSLVSSASAFFSFHLLTGKMGPRPFYRATARVYEPIQKSRGDTYKGLRSGEVFRLHYSPLRIEAVQRAEGRGR